MAILLPVFFLAARSPAQTTQTFYSPAGQLNSLDINNLSARAAALGSAFTGLADDSSALFSNPAGLAWLTKGEITLNSHLGLADTLQETAVLGLATGKWGGFGLACSYLDYGTMEGRDNLGSLAPNYSANRWGLQEGWGVKILEPLSLGVALLYSRESVSGTGSSFFVPEAGLLWEPLKNLRCGLAYEYGGWSSIPGNLDSFLKVGASYLFRIDPSFQLLAALDDSMELNSLNYFQTGVEASWKSRYFLRAGYRGAFTDNEYGGFWGFSFGGGLALAGFNLDYAYLPYGDLGNMHRFSVTYPFGILGGSSDLATHSKTRTGVKVSAAGVGNKSAVPSGNSIDPGSYPAYSRGASPAAENGGGPNGISTGGSNANQASTQSPSKPDAQSTSQNSLVLRFNIPPDFMAQGNDMMAQNRPSEAVTLYQQALKENDQNPQAWWVLGKAYFRLHQKNHVILCLEKVLALNPEDTTLREWLEKYKAQKP